MGSTRESFIRADGSEQSPADGGVLLSLAGVRQIEDDTPGLSGNEKSSLGLFSTASSCSNFLNKGSAVIGAQEW